MNCNFVPTDYVHGRKRYLRYHKCSRPECGKGIFLSPAQKAGRTECKQPHVKAGDLVAKVASSLGFEKTPGCGCDARQKALNVLISFPKPGWLSILTGKRVRGLPEDMAYEPMKGSLSYLWYHLSHNMRKMFS